jgi:hypothetical protein
MPKPPMMSSVPKAHDETVARFIMAGARLHAQDTLIINRVNDTFCFGLIRQMPAPTPSSSQTKFSSLHSLQISFNLVKSPNGLDLTPSVLASDRQIHRVSPSSIRARIPQPFDVLQDRPFQLVLDLHAVERGIEVQDLLLRQFAHLHRAV